MIHYVLSLMIAEQFVQAAIHVLQETVMTDDKWVSSHPTRESEYRVRSLSQESVGQQNKASSSEDSSRLPQGPL